MKNNYPESLLDNLDFLLQHATGQGISQILLEKKPGTVRVPVQDPKEKAPHKIVKKEGKIFKKVKMANGTVVRIPYHL